jgi:hypothetical protein
MRRHAALVVASILTAEKSRDYSVMGCSAKRVLQEGVSFARKCGTCFNSMPELAKIQIAMCRGAGLLKPSSFVHIHTVSVFTCIALPSAIDLTTCGKLCTEI